jgi:hypothetical protein
MQYLTPKPPGATVECLIPWGDQIGADPIVSFTLTVSSGTVTVSAQTNYGTYIAFLLSGGANGETATLHNQITTAGGEVLDRDLQVQILSAAIAVTPSTATKQAVVDMAFEEIGLAGYDFDATQEEYASALRRLDGLMAEWQGPGNNYAIGYNAPAVFGQGALEDLIGIPDSLLNCTSIALALRIMPNIGKTMSLESRVAYGQGMNAMRAAFGVTLNRSLQRRTPRGAGNKPSSTWTPFGPLNGAA